MTHFMKTTLTIIAFMITTSAWAQGTTWLQIEARPNLGLAEQRANDYAARLPDVNGFRLRSGWYAIALGPYSENDAPGVLAQLRASGAIPNDAFLADGRQFLEQFFGPTNAAQVQTEPAAPLEPLTPGEETPAEARAAERGLSREDRELVQIALRWEGFYRSTIDASFGPGTRRAMSAWQEDRRYEPTGILTTLQRRELLDGYQSVLSALNMSPVVDPRAGIEIDLPAGMVSFDRYEPPFAHYASRTDDNVRVILISQTGTRDTLAALYDIMQTLEIVPLNGAREIRRRDFTLTGANDDVVSHTYARLDGDAIKGFSLIWPAGDEKRRRLALAEMEASFRPTDGVLPDTIGGSAQNIDLLSGLEIRRADRTRSGFYVDGGGAVLTTSEAVRQCTRITLNGEMNANVTAEDTGLGLALLTPEQSLAPLAVAALSASEPRLQSDVAVAGYSFGGLLTAPSVTFGTFADIKGLDGDTRVQRLDVAAETGDAGGPVFDGMGGVMGMLLDQKEGARQLPAGVAFAADAPVLDAFLTSNGLSSLVKEPAEDMAPEDLTLLAADMTVLVSCWN